MLLLRYIVVIIHYYCAKLLCYIILLPEKNDRNLPVVPSSGTPCNSSLTVYVIIPTYARASQRADITSLVQTLSLACNVHAIVIEDAKKPSPWLQTLLYTNSVQFTHLACTSSNLEMRKALRGKSQRNCGLNWLKKSNIRKGVIYFADDDNTFDYELFDHVSAIYTANPCARTQTRLRALAYAQRHRKVHTHSYT